MDEDEHDGGDGDEDYFSPELEEVIEVEEYSVDEADDKDEDEDEDEDMVTIGTWGVEHP